MPPVGLEPTISEAERPRTYALDRAATGFIRTTLTKYVMSMYCKVIGQSMNIISDTVNLKLNKVTNS